VVLFFFSKKKPQTYFVKRHAWAAMHNSVFAAKPYHCMVSASSWYNHKTLNTFVHVVIE